MMTLNLILLRVQIMLRSHSINYFNIRHILLYAKRWFLQDIGENNALTIFWRHYLRHWWRQVLFWSSFVCLFVCLLPR